MSGPAFVHRVTVYWEDTDAGGIVYHANYLRFLERARTEWLRALGWPQRVLREVHGIVFVVASMNVRFAAPARLDDVLDCDVAVARAGTVALDLRQRVVRDASPVCEADVRIGCVDAGTFKPCRIPTAVLEHFR